MKLKICFCLLTSVDVSLSRDGSYHTKKVLPAIHLEADVPRFERSDTLKTDSILRNWNLSRWAKKLKMDSQFLVNNGKLTVMSAGIYFVYAQVDNLIIYL